MVTPVAMPSTCVCTETAAADLHTSLLFTTTEGAEAVGTLLSVTTVEDTVLLSAPYKEVQDSISIATSIYGSL